MSIISNWPFIFRAAPSGYLPAADAYEVDLAGYNADQAGARGDDLAGYGDDDLSGYGDSQEEYGDDQYLYDEETEDKLEEGYAAQAGAAASDLSRPADEKYGAPAVGSASNLDPSYAAPDDGYGAPDDNTGLTAPVEAAVKNVVEGYTAPAGAGADASRTADEEYAAPGDDGWLWSS